MSFYQHGKLRFEISSYFYKQFFSNILFSLNRNNGNILPHSFTVHKVCGIIAVSMGVTVSYRDRRCLVEKLLF